MVMEFIGLVLGETTGVVLFNSHVVKLHSKY